MERLKKNTKGFSLVELIIVIAIMVALIAVMAPSFVKYVGKSRDATLQESAESVLEMAKGEYASGFLNVADEVDSAAIYVYADDDGTMHIAYDHSKIVYQDADSGSTEFIDVCGLDTNKKCLSKVIYKIDINRDNDGRIFALDVTGETIPAECTERA